MEEEIEYGEYIRVMIKLDLSKSLLRKKKLAIEELEPMWISFIYERLLDFCYNCGIIGHGFKECALRDGKGKHVYGEQLPYCVNLRAGFQGSMKLKMNGNPGETKQGDVNC